MISGGQSDDPVGNRSGLEKRSSGDDLARQRNCGSFVPSLEEMSIEISTHLVPIGGVY
jgi:hypothetical protein